MLYVIYIYIYIYKYFEICRDQYNFQFHDARSMLFHTLEELLEIFDKAKRGRYILQPYDKSQKAFECIAFLSTVCELDFCLLN